MRKDVLTQTFARRKNIKPMCHSVLAYNGCTTWLNGKEAQKVQKNIKVKKTQIASKLQVQAQDLTSEEERVAEEEE